MFAVDLTSMFTCSKAVVPGMVERRFGRIVNISSVAGKRGGGFLGRVAYSSAKAGVLGFTKALARELAPHGITVNAVAPGAMDTEMTKSLRDDPELLARVQSQIPLGYRGAIQANAFATGRRSSPFRSAKPLSDPGSSPCFVIFRHRCLTKT